MHHKKLHLPEKKKKNQNKIIFFNAIFFNIFFFFFLNLELIFKDKIGARVSMFFSFREKHIRIYIIGHYNTLVRNKTYLPTLAMLCELILFMRGKSYNQLTLNLDDIFENVDERNIFWYFTFQDLKFEPTYWTTVIIIKNHLISAYSLQCYFKSYNIFFLS